MRKQSVLNRFGKKLITVLLPEPLRVVLYPLLRGRPIVNPFKPKTFNDFINSNKLNERYAEICLLQDKLLAKEWVSCVAPEVRTPKTFRVFHSPDEIDPRRLPAQCVLKTNNGCGFNYIHRSSNAEVPSDHIIDWQEIRNGFKFALREPFGKASVEWSYFYIKPILYCEEFLCAETTDGDLVDYKVFVFEGKACLIQVDLDRFHGHKRILMDRDWRPLKVSYEYPLPSILPEKPVNLTGLLEAAEKVAKTLIFCRVDFYILGGELYFGEVAFYPEGGYGIFEPRKFNEGLLKGLQNEGCFDEIYYM